MTVVDDPGLVLRRQPPIARACPPVSDPSTIAAWTAESRSRRRSVFVIVDLARPTRCAISSWVSPNSSTSCAERVRLLDRAEVRPLEVLDEGELELVAIRELADDRRDALEAGQLAGAESPFAGDELVAVEGLGHEDRLEHAVLADARGQALELGVVHALAGLARVGADPVERDVAGAGACWLRCGISDDRPRPRPSGAPSGRSSDASGGRRGGRGIG